MKNNIIKLIDKLKQNRDLTKTEWIYLISNVVKSNDAKNYLFSEAQKEAKKKYSNKIFIRGLIEISSICKNNCLYCGLRCANENAQRYHLDKDEILSRCKIGYELGFRTFVLQGGEDIFFDDEKMCDIIKSIKLKYNDCAVTLSLGERSFESYKKMYDAGADRYLLRHETANREHYYKLHPHSMSFENRQQCLKNLKTIGYQVGSGFMVGSPYQTDECLADDMVFLTKLKPQMVGIGPFIHHKDTPFKSFISGTCEKTLVMVALTRLLLPNALIPSTTALGTIEDGGREKGILCGANVIMPNLSPSDVKEKYMLYDNKLSTGAESAEHLIILNERMKKIGYEIVSSRGDYTEN